ncbi:MAG TPA: nucleoside triphosphate pyrophosphohydrolase [Hyphomicrobiales bacterium]|jgi:ATP diphosphatase
MSTDQDSPSDDAVARIARLNAKVAEPDPMTVDDLLSLMAVLRDAEHGCPWDHEQTFATIAPFTIEEAYEVADAIARGDLTDLKDELGDLLLQVVYHARMAEEGNAFDFHAVVDAITRKMIRRHPHVFGDEEVKAGVQLRGLWDRVKAEEAEAKRAATGAAPASEASHLAGVPLALPALSRSVKLQRRAAKVGFDWARAQQILDKVKEELGELEEEMAAGDPAHIQEEFGDLLFVLANLARRLDVDPETALQNANAKFERRFRHVEKRLQEQGRVLGEASLDEMEVYWNEIRALDKAK